MHIIWCVYLPKIANIGPDLSELLIIINVSGLYFLLYHSVSYIGYIFADGQTHYEGLTHTSMCENLIYTIVLRNQKIVWFHCILARSLYRNPTCEVVTSDYTVLAAFKYCLLVAISCLQSRSNFKAIKIICLWEMFLFQISVLLRVLILDLLLARQYWWCKWFLSRLFDRTSLSLSVWLCVRC